MVIADTILTLAVADCGRFERALWKFVEMYANVW